MLRFEILGDLLLFALWIFCVFDVLTSDEGAIRNLPKLPWVMIVIFLPLIGSIAWLVAGRPENRQRAVSKYERPTPEFPEYDRPGRAAATNPEDDEAFLRQVRERAEAQRQRYREQRRQEQQAQERPQQSETDGQE